MGLGPPQFYYLTINPDASIVATWGANWQWGTITVNGTEGARFELDHITSGTLLYYSGTERSVHPDDARLRRLVRLGDSRQVARPRAPRHAVTFASIWAACTSRCSA